MPPREGLDLGDAVETLRDLAHLAQRLDKDREIIQSRCQLVQLGIRAPVRKVGEGVELVFDGLRRDTRGESSDRNDKRAVLDNGDGHHASPSARVGARRSMRACKPISGPAMMMPPGVFSSDVAKTGSRTGRQHLKCAAASSRLMRGDV